MKRMITALTGGLLALVAVSALAATLAITQANWSASNGTLSIRGTGTSRATVTVTNARTGGSVGTARANETGRWSLTRSKLPDVPCRVTAVQGGVAVERDVDGAPSNCAGPSITLNAVTVSGPATVTEGTSASYVAMATFSDGKTQDVTAAAAWSENSGYATIAAGVLRTSDVPSNQAVTVNASFAAGGVTRTGSFVVTLQDVPPPPALTGSHAGRFMTYDGTATCLKCHQNEAEAFHQSTHYQWQGDAIESTGLNPGPAGKLGGINDFCIYPDINWLGKLTTVTGKVVDGGCARCHTGKGLKPTPEITQIQLENIDCLLCHSPNYKRTLQLVNGQYGFVADTASMSVSLLQAAVDIRRPGSDQCLNCHTKAGGGNNLKRGDIEEAHRPATATVNLDVHMAPRDAGGAGLTCTSCHTTIGHRIAGRGVDMRQRDLLNAPVKCTNCHPATPHGDSALNRHTARLECNVCHVPTFAKTAPTDMRRDWSLPGDLNAQTGLYEPHMVLQTNVTPVYRFFNGRSQFYQFGTPAVPAANGRVLMAGPLGSITEAGAKITAMKRHEGRQPVDPITGWLIPLKIGVFFQKNDIATAITQGVAAMGWTANGYAFAETERFMGLYHEVAPKEQAVQCSSCHGGTRINFAALGYTPLTTRNGLPLCASCHQARTASFKDLHDKHREKGYDCSTCHTFRKAV